MNSQGERREGRIAEISGWDAEENFFVEKAFLQEDGDDGRTFDESRGTGDIQSFEHQLVSRKWRRGHFGARGGDDTAAAQGSNHEGAAGVHVSGADGELNGFP
jgi:hypothetical protein